MAVLGLLALRDDPPALALRAGALAQLGEFERATRLLRRAARGFGRRHPMSVAKCIVAEAEIALVARELSWPGSRLERARATLERQGDHHNAMHARHLAVRRLTLVGALDEAERAIGAIEPEMLPPNLRVAHELIVAQIASRRLRIDDARAALTRAIVMAKQAGNPILLTEACAAHQTLDRNAAKLIRNGAEAPATLDDIAVVLSSDALVIDICRGSVRQRDAAISLATRPIQLKLLRALGAAWPKAAARSDLVTSLFGDSDVDAPQRARLRVAINRLRLAIAPFAGIVATTSGFRLVPRDGRPPVVIVPPVESGDAALIALLADGAAWSSASLAIALGISQRTVQRGLDELAVTGEVQAIGRGRARRWMSRTLLTFTTALLLPGAGLSE